MREYNIAVLGATGVVGEAIISILEQYQLPIDTLYPLASARSAGEFVDFAGKSYEILDVADFDFSQVQIALFSAGASVSAEYAPRAAAGCVVIDNTSQFRYDFDVPLVIPEVNPQAIGQYHDRHIIANPNCSTIQMLVALKPIYDAVGISRINVATYQAVSGSGKKGIQELAQQSGQLLNGQVLDKQVYPVQIAYNVLPQIDGFEANGYTREEMKMVWETQKILQDEIIQVNPTAVRVPVFFGHSEAIHIETRAKLEVSQVRELLQAAPGIVVMDERQEGGYPTPVTQAIGADAVFVGRLREDISHPTGLNLWVVADNVRKGAALNAVQIAQQLIQDYL